MGDVSSINLHFEDSGEWSILPSWAEYFINVGKQLVLAGSDSASRIVTAIVVPTRAYCAAFISYGMVFSTLRRMEQPSEAVTHFRYLLALPPGTPVICYEGLGRTYKGIMQPPQERYGEQHVRVQLSAPSKKGSGVTYLINEARALIVQLAKHSGKLPKNPSGKNKHFSNEFVNSLLGDSDPVQLGIQSKFVCAIIGKKSLLEYEVCQTPLAVHLDGDQWEKGLLQDVLRVDRFIAGRQFPRSILIPVGLSQPTSDITSKIEIGVVYDGAAGFIKWGERMWPDIHQVIILDRTERYFYDAIVAINSRFSQNRATTELSLSYSDVSLPPGTELLAFREMIS